MPKLWLMLRRFRQHSSYLRRIRYQPFDSVSMLAIFCCCDIGLTLQNTIASLKKEIEKAWKMVDAAHEKEVTRKLWHICTC